MPEADEADRLRARILQACWGGDASGEIEPTIRAQLDALMVSLFAISADAREAEVNIRNAAADMLSDVAARYHGYQAEAAACHEAHATKQ